MRKRMRDIEPGDVCVDCGRTVQYRPVDADDIGGQAAPAPLWVCGCKDVIAGPNVPA